MLTYNLQKSTKVPLYENLYTCIKNDITTGRLVKNEKLPSKRVFAQHLKVSVITVETAYEQLLSEGFIFAKERRGYFVSDIIVENKCEEKIKLSQVQEKPKEYFLDLKNNGINENNFPFSSWSKIMREVLANKPQGLLTAMPFNGAKVLREAIAKHLYDFRGCVVDSENIVVGAGTEFLYSLIIELLGRDKNFALEDPGYNKIAKIYATNGVPFSYIPLDDDGVCVEELYKTNADIVHITPSHHFPTGIVMPIKRRQELLVWAKEKEGRFVIEDDYDSEFRFVGKPLPTMQSLDEKLVIYINSFTKTLSPSIRISFMVLPPQLMQKFKEQLSFYSNTVSSLEQLALAKFIGNGNFESHLNRMKKLYRQQRDKTINAICESGFCDKSDIYEQEAGLHFLLKIKTEKTDDQFRKLAQQKGINISMLSDYAFKKSLKFEHFAVINYSSINTENVKDGFSVLKTLI